jgi:hypothetical protein
VREFLTAENAEEDAEVAGGSPIRFLQSASSVQNAEPKAGISVRDCSGYVIVATGHALWLQSHMSVKPDPNLAR